MTNFRFPANEFPSQRRFQDEPGGVRQRSTAMSMSAKCFQGFRAMVASGMGLLVGCSASKEEILSRESKEITHSDNLKFLASYPLAIKEPSGLSLSSDGKSLWTVSDEGGKVYQMTLEGEIMKKFPTKLKDLEGIAVVDESTIAVVSERQREVVLFDTEGHRKESGFIDIPGKDNDGPEALDYDPVLGRYYILKEKSPGLLIELDHTLQELSRTELFLASDYSSIAHESVRDHLWVLSHESGSVQVVDHEMNVMATFAENIPQAEGIAVDYKTKRMYLVSDPEERLYVFEFADY